jgi:hypothetical protein
VQILSSECMTRAYAQAADENGWFEQAAAGYEAALLADPADLEATVNLAVLYWQAAGHGAGAVGHCACAAGHGAYAAGHSTCASGALTAGFSSHANRRLHELLESASSRFADRAEVCFWNKYIAAAESGEPLEPRECLQLMRDHPDYLEPAFVVFAESAGEEAEPEAMRLLADCSERPTARGRYVTSIISAALRRQRWRSACPATI